MLLDSSQDSSSLISPFSLPLSLAPYSLMSPFSLPLSLAPYSLMSPFSLFSGESHDDEESDDEIDPSRQAVPTTDLLFMRRAAKHMPMGSAGPKTTRRSAVIQ